MNAEIESERLWLRKVDDADAPFILRLLNEPSWIQYIGDRGVRTLDDARRYIHEGPRRMYDAYGLGLFAVTLRGGGPPLGLCGLLQRPELQHPDLGFAFLPEAWGQGFAFEAAAAVLREADAEGRHRRILAIVSPGNDRSVHLLGKAGFAAEGTVTLKPDGEELLLFAYDVNHRSPG